jgi:hypothetical protein
MSDAAEAIDLTGAPRATEAEARAFVEEVRKGLETRALVPYMGPGVAASAHSTVPCSNEDMAAFLGKKAALPKRVRGNMWASAQYIESQRHRATLKLWLEDASAFSFIQVAVDRRHLV